MAEMNAPLSQAALDTLKEQPGDMALVVTVDSDTGKVRFGLWAKSAPLMREAYVLAAVAADAIADSYEASRDEAPRDAQNQQPEPPAILAIAAGVGSVEEGGK